MNHSPTINTPKVRPRILLWTLLVLQLGFAICFLGTAWTYERAASALDVREPEMRKEMTATTAMIQTGTDIAQIRDSAVKACDLNFEYWRDKSYRLHQGSGAMRTHAVLGKR